MKKIAASDGTIKEPDDLGDDLKFWRLSYEIQIRLGKTPREAKSHADDYVAKLKAADETRLGDGASWDDPQFGGAP